MILGLNIISLLRGLVDRILVQHVISLLAVPSTSILIPLGQFICCLLVCMFLTFLCCRVKASVNEKQKKQKNK